MPPKATVLIVEDEPILLMMYEDLFRERGFEVVPVADGDRALAIIASDALETVDCLVTDIRLPGDVPGWEVAVQARRHRPSLPVIYVTGDSQHGWRTLGVRDSVIFTKPIEIDLIIDEVETMLQREVRP